MQLSNSGERIQKVLAMEGLGSRRGVEDLIKRGKIIVNGKVAKLGDKVTIQDKILFEGKLVRYKVFAGEEETKVLIYNKQEGEVCTRNDEEGRPNIFANLPKLRVGRWINVGRLDLNTQGLILITNDGDLANKLMHPSSELEREYAVRVLGDVDPEDLYKLSTGVKLDDGTIGKFDRVFEAGGEGANHWYHVVVREGRNRLVRRVWEAIDIRISRLIRVRYGNINLPADLRRGTYRDLTPEEIILLKRQIKKVKISSVKENLPAQESSEVNDNQVVKERKKTREFKQHSRTNASKSTPRKPIRKTTSTTRNDRKK